MCNNNLYNTYKLKKYKSHLLTINHTYAMIRPSKGQGHKAKGQARLINHCTFSNVYDTLYPIGANILLASSTLKFFLCMSL